MQYLSLEGVPICILIVQDNIFITMLEGGHPLPIWHPDIQRNLTYTFQSSTCGHCYGWSSKVTTLQKAGNPTLDPSHLYSFHWGVGGQRDRQKAPSLCLLNLNTFICHQSPGLVCYHLERSGWQQNHCSWILQLKNISDYLCRCLSPFQLQQNIINWVDYKQTYFKYFWRLSPRLKCLEVWHLV